MYRLPLDRSAKSGDFRGDVTPLRGAKEKVFVGNNSDLHTQELGATNSTPLGLIR